MKSVGSFLKQLVNGERWLWSTAAATAVAVGLLGRTTPPAEVRAIAATTPAREEKAAPAKPAMRSVPGLEETLVAMRPTSTDDDRALSEAIAAFRARAGQSSDAIDAYQPFVDFVRERPLSGWSVAVQTNLGLAYYRAGYFSRAFESWEAAWEAGRTAAEPRAKALVDRAIAELTRMHARIGHAEQVQRLLREIGDRPISGSATETITGAREGAWLMQHDWGTAYLCGPHALRNILIARHAPPKDLAFLDEIRSGEHGFSLDQVAALARRAKLAYRLVHREPGQTIPVPAIVHWKVNHYAAVTELRGGRYHVQDPTFGGANGDLSVSAAAIDAEASGYFLVPRDQAQGKGWRSVSDVEARQVFGMGTTNTSQEGATTPGDAKLNEANCNKGMCAYNAHTMLVSLNLNDTPIGYSPQKGPPVAVRFTYNQREANQPANPAFFNVSAKWTLSVLSYVQDNPLAAGTGVTRYVAGGGTITYTGYSGASGAFAPERQAQATLVRIPASGEVSSYELRAADGSKQIFARSDGAATSPRRMFLTKVIDPTGNALELKYDDQAEAGQTRLTAIRDAAGRDTIFTYKSDSPLLVEDITDPFGRSAHLSYDANGRLRAIRDVLGLESSFSYDDSGFVKSMKTPYGTSQFAYGDLPGNGRWLEMTDAMGFSERLEFTHSGTIPATIDPGQVPSGINIVNGYYAYRNTFHWDKRTFKLHGSGTSKDYGKASFTHWLHTAGGQTSPIAEGLKKPLEGRVFYNYPNQGAAYSDGSIDAPSAVGRVLDDGSTQLTRFTYGPLGNPLSAVDPAGRTTNFEYAANNVDLLAVRRVVPGAAPATLATFGYYEGGQHLLKAATDAAGNVTSYGYNAAGQLTSVTDAKKNLTTYEYDELGRLVVVADAKGSALLTLGYDENDRVASREDAAGYVVRYEYDALDRLIKATYPDGTFETYAYDKLDLVAVTDRLGRATSLSYDANRRLTKATDALNHATRYEYYEDGALKSLTDANNHTTSWERDVQGRIIAKRFANGASQSVVYEANTSRVKSLVDALGQRTEYTYNADDTLSDIRYPNASTETSSVHFEYDTAFQRLVGMSDGAGDTSFAYYPFGAQPKPGAGLLQFVVSPVAGSEVAADTLRLNYDALNRVTSKTLNGAVETLAYDALGRVSSASNALDTFALSYTDPTARVKKITAKVGPSLGLDYLDAKGDHLVQRVTFSRTDDALLSEFGYTYDADHNVASFSETHPGQKFAAAPVIAPRESEPARRERIGGFSGLLFALFTGLVFALLAGARVASARAKRWVGALLMPAMLALVVTSCGDDDSAPEATGGAGAGGAGGAGAGGAHAGAGGEVSAGAPNGGGGPTGQGGAGTGASAGSDTGTGAAATGGSIAMPAGGSGGQGGPEGGGGAGEGGAGTAEPSIQTTSYEYDDANRLTSALVASDLGAPDRPQFEYAYDAVSNLTKITRDGATRSFKHTATNGIAGLDYDLNGSPQSQGSKQYTWDGANRLVKVVDGDKSSEFTYDGLSRMVRIVEKDGGEILADRAFTWCGATRCLERDNLQSGSPVVKQFFPQGVRVGNKSYFYVTDQLGSVRQLVDASGSVVAQFDYDPYGNRRQISGDVDADFGYAGYFHHERSGLEFALYRAYDPSVGRWLNRDPIGETGGINLYGYVGGNPSTETDALGLYAGVDDAVAIGSGAFFGIVGQGVADLISGKLSSWQDYVSSAVGGAAGGEAFLYTGPIGAGLAGSAARNLVSQGLNNLTGKQCGFDAVGFAKETAIGGLGGLGGSLAGRVAARMSQSSAQAARLSRQLASEEIAGGHAFVKHVVERGEFPGIRTRGQFAEMVEGVLENASHVRQLSGGRTAFWKDGVVVIRNPGAVDGGTAFVPTTGFKYFEGLK